MPKIDIVTQKQVAGTFLGTISSKKVTKHSGKGRKGNSVYYIHKKNLHDALHG